MTENILQRNDDKVLAIVRARQRLSRSFTGVAHVDDAPVNVPTSTTAASDSSAMEIPMNSHLRLLKNNRIWSDEVRRVQPNFFSTLAQVQSPDFLWIGCSDSRVPANEITGTLPGEIFVHRNIANLVVATDFNLLAVLQYSVEVLKVRHVILCGHYGCGGVRAAMGRDDHGILSHWLCQIKDIYQANRQELDAITEPQLREDRLVELSVEAQVRNLTKTTVIQQAWARGEGPVIHGWVYGLQDGILRPRVTCSSTSYVPEIYEITESTATQLPADATT